MRAPIGGRALTHDVAFCSQIFDQKRDLTQSTASRKGANSNGRLFEIAPLFDSFFQSSPDLTKSLISHWQCEATIIVKSVGKATSFFTSFLSFFLSFSLPSLAKC